MMEPNNDSQTITCRCGHREEIFEVMTAAQRRMWESENCLECERAADEAMRAYWRDEVSGTPEYVRD